MKNIQISILICTHNRGALLKRTLESVDQITPVRDSGVEVLVVANACTDDTARVAAEWAERSTWPARVVVESRAGLSVARNRAVREASGEVCAFLDDDVWLDPGWLHGIRDAFIEHRADLVGGRVDLWWEELERPTWLPAVADSILSANNGGDKVTVLDAPWRVIGANFAFRREVFDRVGAFDEALGRTASNLLGGEESDFVWRTLRQGLRVLYVPGARLKHWVPAQRVTTRYMTGVSFGNGVSQVLVKPRLSPRRYLRALLGHSALVVWHASAWPVAWLRRDRGACLMHRCRMAVGRGGLVGLWRRMRSGVGSAE